MLRSSCESVTKLRWSHLWGPNAGRPKIGLRQRACWIVLWECYSVSFRTWVPSDLEVRQFLEHEKDQKLADGVPWHALARPNVEQVHTGIDAISHADMHCPPNVDLGSAFRVGQRWYSVVFFCCSFAVWHHPYHDHSPIMTAHWLKVFYPRSRSFLAVEGTPLRMWSASRDRTSGCLDAQSWCFWCGTSSNSISQCAYA